MDKFDTIADFIKVKEYCVFCKTPLRAKLSSYVGPSGEGIASLNALLTNDRFEFKLQRTTPSFEVKADVFIFPDRNTLIFDNFTNDSNGTLPGQKSTPNIDEFVTQRAFEDYGPHFELYCPSAKCGLNYYLSTYPIKLKKLHKVTGMWYVQPVTLFTESARVNNYVITNVWDSKISRIYSRKNLDAPPITVPMVDFTTMTKERLITRIKTLVTFS